MCVYDAVIQAILQGLTEFLPISSSGHLKLWQFMTGQAPAQGTFLLVILHLGTLAAVILAFRETVAALLREFLLLVRDLLTGRIRRAKITPERRMLLMLMISTALLAPFYLLKDVFENLALPALALCFLFTSLELFFTEKFRDTQKTAGDLTVRDAVVIGLFQCAALFPGISRSGSTVSGGLFSGLSRETAVQYSFVLGIPAILGGCAVELREALQGEIAVNWLAAGIGFVIAAAVGILAIGLVKRLLCADRFRVFAVYTLAVSLLTFGYWLFFRR